MLTKVSASEDGSESVVCFNSAWNHSVSFRVESLLVRGGGVKMVNFCLSLIRVQCLVFGSSPPVIVDCATCSDSTGNLGMGRLRCLGVQGLVVYVQ